MDEKRRFGEDEVFYIYDRVETRNGKRREILREYGYEIRKFENAAAKSMDERPFGTDFAEAQRRRARPHRSEAGEGRTIRTDGGGYSYRPASAPRGAEGYAAATAERPRPLKLVLDKVINMFESIEERAGNDEKIAKHRAIAQKKWSDNRNSIFTAALLVVLTAAIAFTVYKLCFVVKNIDVYGSEAYSPASIAEASGIEIGDNLYSFKAEDAEAEITFRCPKIRSAEVTRSIPVNVRINAVDDKAVYVADIWGDRVELSAGLRVLSVTHDTADGGDGLIELVLPAVKYSVAGRVIEFTDARDDRVVRSVLGEIEQSAAGKNGMIDRVDLTNEYDITMKASGLYTLRLGGEEDMELKLRMMNKTITSGTLDSGVPASIDLSKVGEASVKYDLH